MRLRFASLACFLAVAMFAPAANAQTWDDAVRELSRGGCYSLSPAAAASAVAAMEAALPGLIDRRRVAAGEVLATLAEVRRLDRDRITASMFLGAERLLGGNRETIGAVQDFSSDLERRWFNMRTQMRLQTRELRSLDLSIRLIEAWLPTWRQCRDYLAAAAPATGGRGTEPALAAVTGSETFEMRLFGLEADGSMSGAGYQYTLRLEFASGGAVSGQVLSDTGDVMGEISGQWSGADANGRWSLRGVGMAGQGAWALTGRTTRPFGHVCLRPTDPVAQRVGQRIGVFWSDLSPPVVIQRSAALPAARLC